MHHIVGVVDFVAVLSDHSHKVPEDDHTVLVDSLDLVPYLDYMVDLVVLHERERDLNCK